MANIYSSDLHFFTESVLTVFQRPFGTVDEMNAALLANIQKTVGDDDDFWILGDFANVTDQANLSGISSIFEKIPGRKHLVAGNHDLEPVHKLGWASIHEITEIDDSGRHIVLCHFPLLTWNKARDGVFHLFGHVHNRWAGTPSSINVAPELWDYRPVRWPAILERAAHLPANPIFGPGPTNTF